MFTSRYRPFLGCKYDNSIYMDGTEGIGPTMLVEISSGPSLPGAYQTVFPHGLHVTDH